MIGGLPFGSYPSWLSEAQAALVRAFSFGDAFAASLSTGGSLAAAGSVGVMFVASASEGGPLAGVASEGQSSPATISVGSAEESV